MEPLCIFLRKPEGSCGTDPGLAPEMAGQLLAFEQGIIELQMQVEQSFLSFARSTGRPSVVVFDRGLLDIPA